MENYLVLKLIHILAAVVVTGTGAGIAFFMFMANRSNNSQAIYITAQHVILGDWIFTTPAVVTQIIIFVALVLLGDRAAYVHWTLLDTCFENSIQVT